MADQDFSSAAELAVPRAQLDQAALMVPLLASLTRSYFNAFVAEGFAEKQALYLAVAQLLQDPGRAA